MVDAFSKVVLNAASAAKKPLGNVQSGENNTNASEIERLEKQQEARKRWKILCIVRTADVKSDETARQEKIQVTKKRKK